MDKRIPLKQNTELRFVNYDGGKIVFIIDNILGMGGSCIVYNGHYINNLEKTYPVLIKECYPYKVGIKRNNDDSLLVDNKDKIRFEEYKTRVKDSFAVSVELHKMSGLTNVTSNLYDIYEKNNTIYVVSSYAEGKTLQNIQFSSINDVIRTTIAIAKAIEKIHEQGYLYLDLKPENVFAYKETSDMIQLFDFDSMIPAADKNDITEYRLSYSAGFAPVEQKMADMKHIGKHTDIYSVGAILFYLLYGRQCNTASDAIIYSEKNLADRIIIQKGIKFQPKVYKELSVLFSNTLQPYYKDRYREMSEVIEQLCLIGKYIDLPVQFICSDYIEKDDRVIGRDTECRSLLTWYEGKEKLICVTGMGGIGKTTVVRKFIDDNRLRFENVVYLKYKNSIDETLIDDVQFHINFCYRYDGESDLEYRIRKLNIAGKLTKEHPTLLVIDNYAGDLKTDVDILSVAEWKIILITRKDVDNKRYLCEKITELDTQRQKYKLFELNAGRKLREEEYPLLDKIINLVKGHTLILVLIAKQISKSYLDMEEALELIKKSGFSEMAQEKVRYIQDGNLFYDKASRVITSIYDINVLSEVMRRYIKILSLFGTFEIDIKRVKQLFEAGSFDDINELADLGWIDIYDGKVQMHPLIQEVVRQMEFDDGARIYAIRVFKYMNNSINNKEYNALDIARAVLKDCEYDAILTSKKEFKELLFNSIMKSSREYEEYIIINAKKLLSDNETNPRNIIRLYDYMVYIFCQKEMHDEATKYIGQAKKYVKKQKDHYMWGLYYDMFGDYLDAVLNGEYGSYDEQEQRILQELLRIQDRAIHHMHMAKDKDSQLLYVKDVLGKAAVMIRSTPEKKRQIRQLIIDAKYTIDRYSICDAKIRSTYFIVCAWFYTLCNQNRELVCKYLHKAELMETYDEIPDLDNIDYFYIPAANMMYELCDRNTAIYWLEQAIAICDKYEDSIPFMRKKRDLQNCILDVRKNLG